LTAGHNKFGFTFEQYGPRVPAIVISPWIPKNSVDHRLYDHSSIPATVEQLFGIDALTKRDRAANSVLSLLSLDAAREDAPATLPSPANPPGSEKLALRREKVEITVWEFFKIGPSLCPLR
jgi:phospholipase C